MQTQTKIKTFSKGQLAAMYAVHPTTFRKWLQKIPKLDLAPAQKILTPKQVQLIFTHLGEP